ncbi:MAG: GAF domain-containing sensor histidine kinase, partial [Deltaproteobacteria bacterium]
MLSEHIEVPTAYLEKWQKTADLLAHIFNVPAGLIMRVLPSEIEVFVSSRTDHNPYEEHERAPLNTGLYCETVMAKRDMLHVPNALEDPVWENNPDVKLNMISYLGVPLIWPNQEVFGTICVLDSKTRHYTSLYEALLWQFKDIIDGDLRLLISERESKQQAVELAKALDHLKTTQDVLVQSEKMAALGHLVAGIAHEINTPLGAIRSSVGNVADFLKQTLPRLPLFFKSLPEEREHDFFALLGKVTHEQSSLSTREKRQLKKSLTERLEACGIENARSVVDKLINTGVHDEDVTELLPLLRSAESEAILEMIYELGVLQRSTYSILTASDRAAKTIFALKSFARFDVSGQAVESNVIDGIETVLTLYQNQLKQGVEVVKQYGQLPIIQCYPDELNQVWTNLVHNALQAMKNRG